MVHSIITCRVTANYCHIQFSKRLLSCCLQSLTSSLAKNINLYYFCAEAHLIVLRQSSDCTYCRRILLEKHLGRSALIGQLCTI